MDLRHVMDRVIHSITLIGLVALLAMMVVVVINVLGRALFRAPFYGTVEFVEISGTFMVSCIAAYTQFKKGNVSVGIIVDRFSPRVQAIFDSFTLLLTLGIAAVLVWAALVAAVEMVQLKEITGIYEVIKYPFRFVWVFGLTVLFVMFLVDFIQSVGKVVQK